MNKYEKLECLENAGWVYTQNQEYHRFTGIYPYKSIWDLNAYEDYDLDRIVERMYDRLIRNSQDLPH